MRLPRLGPIGTATVIGVMLCCFAALSFTAILGKSATYDEPLHFVGGMTIRYAHDFRINPEDPALFGWWASLPQGRSALPLDTSDAFFEGTISDLDQRWFFAVETLYQHGAVQADRILNTSRAMFVVVGVGLGALIACWAYQIRGPWAAISSTLLFCFDPNFLAHSALIKNDVAFSLMMCLLGFFLWRLGKNGGWHWLGLAALACAVAFNVKLSAVLLGPMLVVLLTTRALLRSPWSISGRVLRNWRQRAMVVLIGVAASLLAVYLLTWCVYGFRYSATATGQPMLTNALLQKSVAARYLVQREKGQLGKISDEDFETLVTDHLRREDYAFPVKADLWMQKHHLLPESWLFGFLFTYAYSIRRASYLLGNVGLTGWWYYFPLTILFKTAAAILAAIIVVPAACAAARWLSRYDDLEDNSGMPITPAKRDWWTVLVLIIPPGIYFLTVMTANLNLGVRHVLPVYPYLYVALGVGAASLLERWPMPTFVLGGVLVLGLLGETINAYPNYLAFFNVFCGGPVGGFRLLGDSNLDWGQDLPALAQWQKEHPTVKLYFSYFGIASPSAYGIDFTNIPGGWPLAPTSALNADEPGVVAISATNLQGIYLGPQLTDAYRAALSGEKPFRILNGTIYLFSWPPRIGNDHTGG